MHGSSRRQQMRYHRQPGDRRRFTPDHHQQGPLPPIPRSHPGSHHPHRRPSSPSSMSSSPYSDDEAPMVRRHPPSRRSRSRSGLDDYPHASISGHHQALMSINGPIYGMYGNGTLRSTRSVPTLNMATWDGEPCPVHGLGSVGMPMMQPGLHFQQPPQMEPLRRSGSMFDMRSPSPFYGPSTMNFYPPPPPSMTFDRKPHPGESVILGPPPFHPGGHPYGLAPPHIPPPHLLPPMMRPRQLVIPAGTEPVQPLPMRDPSKNSYRPPSSMQTLPKKIDEEGGYEEVEGSFCKGHLIVLWIILGVVTLGVLLGIVLGVIMG